MASYAIALLPCHYRFDVRSAKNVSTSVHCKNQLETRLVKAEAPYDRFKLSASQIPAPRIYFFSLSLSFFL